MGKFFLLLFFPLALCAQSGVTFHVETLSPNPGKLPMVATPAEAVWYRPGVDSLVCGMEKAGLYDVVKLAFARHYPLALSPDLIWQMIAGGIAQHIYLHADSLRPLVVTFGGSQPKELIRRLEVNGVGRKTFTRSDWEAEIAAYCALVQQNDIQPAFDSLMRPSFSTTTSFETNVHDIVALAAVKDFFRFKTGIYTICGIPSVTLEGTPADWRDIRRRCTHLQEYGLGWWQDDLLPVLDQFVAASEGHPDTLFWQNIWQVHPPTPGPRFCGYSPNGTTGWVTRFYPYLDGEPNQRLYTNNQDIYLEEKHFKEFYGAFPITIEHHEQRGVVWTETYEIWAGLQGVSVNPQTQALRPEICWGAAKEEHNNRLPVKKQATEIRYDSMGWAGLWDVPTGAPNVRVLRASGNNFISLPQELLTMPMLDTLILAGNSLLLGGYYPLLTKVSAASYWTMIRRETPETPPSETLVAQGREMLTEPLSISLHYIDLSNNNLSDEFVASLALWQPRHTDTVRVDLSNNWIRYLPQNIAKINYPLVLNLSENQLENWPPAFEIPANVRLIYQPPAPRQPDCDFPDFPDACEMDSYQERIPQPQPQIEEVEEIPEKSTPKNHP